MAMRRNGVGPLSTVQARIVYTACFILDHDRYAVKVVYSILHHRPALLDRAGRNALDKLKALLDLSTLGTLLRMRLV